MGQQIEWKEDTLNNTVEGWFEGIMYFDIEKHLNTEEVTLYQMKKPLGNHVDFSNTIEAMKYCERILNPLK